MRRQPKDFFDDTSSSAKQTTTQSISSGDDHGSSSESDESIQSFMGARTVNIFILSESVVNETPPSDYEPKGLDANIWIKEDSTFREIKEYLKQLGRPHIILLQASYGPRPHWTEASLDAIVESTCQVLYAVEVRKDRRYTLGVVRTRRTDYPVAIFDSPNDARLSVLQALVSSASRYHIESITLYSGSREVGEETYDYDSLKTSETPSFPTVFFVTLSEPSQDFLADASTGSIPPMLQMSFVGCRHLLQRSLDLKDFCLQMIHVSRALFHTIISLAKAIKGALKGSSHDARALIERSSFLSHGINLLVKDMEKIMEDLQRKIFQKEQIRLGVEKVFLGLCGEYPGAVTVRHSHKVFQALAHLDHEDESKRLHGNPDGEHGSTPMSRHAVIRTGYEDLAPSDPPMGQTNNPTAAHAQAENTDPRVIAAQTSLENAVILSDNPFWLVRSSQVTLTDLSSLVASSLDTTPFPQNTAIAAGIQKCFTLWETREDGLISLTQTALRHLETSHINAENLLSNLEIHDQLLSETRSAIRGVKNALDGFNPTSHLRLALVGESGSGKSLFINSLIGRALILTRVFHGSRGTPCPMTIQHVRGHTGHATLNVDTAYFHEYLQALRKVDLTKGLLKVVREQRLDPRQERHLQMFQSYDFSFTKISSGDDEIFETQIMVGDLFYLCDLFSGSVDGQWPRPTGTNWPKLTVHLKELSDVEDFQIIETPQGIYSSGGGHVRHMVENTHRDVLNKVDGVIAVTPSHHIARFGLSGTNFGRTGLEAEQAPVTLTVYIGDDRPRLLNTGNFVVANPKLYIDSLRAEESLKSTSSLWDLNSSLTYMKEVAPAEYEAMKSFRYLLSRGDLREEEMYSGKLAMESAQKMIMRCDYARVRHAIGGAIHSSIIWRLLRKMVEVLAHIDQVQRAEVFLLQNLSAANDTPSSVAPTVEYLLAIQSVVYQWKAVLETSLEPTRQEIIHNILARSFGSAHRGLLSKISDSLKHTRMLKSPTEARDFFDGLRRQIESELEAAQADIIWHVQANARKLWITSLQDLRLKISQVAFTEQDMTLDAYKENLLRRLSTLSTSSLRRQVQKEFEDRIRLLSLETSELSDQLYQAVSLAEQKFETQVLGEYTHRGLNDVELDFSHTISLGAELINQMGLLVRMSIPVSRSYRPTYPDVLKAAFPIIMDEAQAVENFSGRALELWKSILDQECRTSIDGVVRLIAGRGMKCVGDIIKEKTGILSKSKYLLDKSVDTSVVWEQLVPLQASTVSAYTGARILCMKLYKEMKFVSSESAYWFQDSMGNAGIDVVLDEPDDDEDFDF